MRVAAMFWLGLLGWCGACAADPAAGPAADGGAERPALEASVLPARTWRLSHAQYARSVQQFLGITPDTTGFEPELDNGVYPNMSGSGSVGAALAHDYYASAEQIAAQLTPEALSQLNGGLPLTAANEQSFLRAAIRRAFRRPPGAEDLAAYAQLFEAELATVVDATSPFRAVVRALLCSPYFLYRTELGSDPRQERFTLTAYELASLLSFSLQGGPPSDALLAAADSGKLDDPAQLAALLDTPQAAEQLSAFLSQWLQIHGFPQLTKDLAVFPDFALHRDALWQEAQRYLGQVGSLTGSLAALLTTPVAPDAQTSAFYGSEPSAGGSAGTRTGVLGLGAVLCAHARLNGTSPTLRGLFVRDRLLCQSVHLPPGGAPNIVDVLLTAQPPTTRALYEQHARNPQCASCHVLLDAIGFNFEDFDGVGRHRTLENGAPIDTSGELLLAGTSSATRDHTELALRLAESAEVSQCFARQAFRFYFGASEPDPDMPALQAAAHAAGSGQLRDVITALLQSPATRQRARHAW